jgi:hypothetical protein
MTFGEGCDATTAGAGQRRAGDIESQHVREGTCGRVTVNMRGFCHRSFFLDQPLGPNRSVRMVEGE